ncbi:MAG: SdpI family protein [Spirochaetes bacterium]|nr:SdpI family protein [Spirochaetota bacterium]
MKKGLFYGFTALLTLAGLLAVAWQWGNFPPRVPTHWNVQGHIDGWGPRWLLWLFALLPGLMGGLAFLVPRLDPKRENYARHETAFFVTMGFSVVIMAVAFWAIFAAASGHPVRVSFILPLAMGLGFIVMGNFLPQVKYNYLFGIRTPWTLANEEVWRKTHRLSGYVFVAMGLGAIASVFFEGKAIAAAFWIVPMIAGITTLFVYSWWVGRGLAKKGS